MLLLLALSTSLVWTAVLTVFVVRDYRLLLRVFRWSTTIYLAIAGILAAEVLREGLVVGGGGGGGGSGHPGPLHASPSPSPSSSALHWDVRVAWTAWFLLVAAALVNWRFLVPAVLLPAWWLSYPEVRMLLAYGVVRLRWTGAVYSPLTWLLSRGGALEAAWRGKQVLQRVVAGFAAPVVRPLGGVLEFLAGVVAARWTEDGLERLRPSQEAAWPFFRGTW
ncbi:hypothetical protein F5Y15DRAFT_422565 [Xylariaceae sp. FL0016]|nr:hypothetical protein F5Y15DRAFT_422565 [Xylariaceae sp. FL0016]